MKVQRRKEVYQKKEKDRNNRKRTGKTVQKGKDMKYKKGLKTEMNRNPYGLPLLPFESSHLKGPESKPAVN